MQEKGQNGIKKGDNKEQMDEGRKMVQKENMGEKENGKEDG